MNFYQEDPGIDQRFDKGHTNAGYEPIEPVGVGIQQIDAADYIRKNGCLSANEVLQILQSVVDRFVRECQNIQPGIKPPDDNTENEYFHAGIG